MSRASTHAVEPTGRASRRSNESLAQIVPSRLWSSIVRSRLLCVWSAAGLAWVDALVAEPSLKAYHLLPSVRGDFLFKLGSLRRGARAVRARRGLTRNAREQELLLKRAAACASGSLS